MKKVTIGIPVYNQERLVIRALDSIPRRDDIEVIVVDDCSTDNTLQNVMLYKSEHPDLDMRVLKNSRNRGAAYTKNRCYDEARGEYIHELDSDDYLYTENYDRVIDMLDGADIVYINLKVNDGRIFALSKETQRGYCGGPCRFIRKDFLGDMRCPEIVVGDDWELNEMMQKKPHTDKFTGIVAYHYNFPREGSLYNQLITGKIKAGDPVD